MVLLSITTAAALVLAHNYSNMISMALGQSNVKITNAAGVEYYASDYASEAEMQSAAAALCRDIEREGMVLLKNTNNALPLPSGARVSLLSQNSVDLVYGGAGNFAAHEPPRSLFTQEVTDSLGDYSDAAIVVIGRSGSESVDLPVDYLSLTAEEEALIQLAGERFETVVLLLNATNPMPLPVLDAEGVDACLWVGALGQGNAGQFNYDAQVQFPFGYGLSYTQFEWSAFRMSETADGFDISVHVRNTGSSAGKEVVQIYLQNPYTDYDRQYGVEKPSVELVGFAKTSLLERRGGRAQRSHEGLRRRRRGHLHRGGRGLLLHRRVQRPRRH